MRNSPSLVGFFLLGSQSLQQCYEYEDSVGGGKRAIRFDFTGFLPSFERGESNDGVLVEPKKKPLANGVNSRFDSAGESSPYTDPPLLCFYLILKKKQPNFLYLPLNSSSLSFDCTELSVWVEAIGIELENSTRCVPFSVNVSCSFTVLVLPFMSSEIFGSFWLFLPISRSLSLIAFAVQPTWLSTDDRRAAFFRLYFFCLFVFFFDGHLIT